MANGRGFEHPFFAARRQPDVIAHRGGCGEWPGQTIYAFERARALGVDVIEMDVSWTKDGELVLMPNINIEEATGRGVRLEDVTFDEVKDLPATRGWPEGDYPPEKVRVTSLRQIFERFSDMRINIELKGRTFPEEMVWKFCRLVEEFGLTERTLVASSWHDTLMEVRRLLPEVATYASNIEMTELSCALSDIFSIDSKMTGFRALNDILSIDPKSINADSLRIHSSFGFLDFNDENHVRRAHRLNLLVHCLIVNKPDEMQRLIAIGVDGIITDYPTALLQRLSRL